MFCIRLYIIELSSLFLSTEIICITTSTEHELILTNLDTQLLHPSFLAQLLVTQLCYSEMLKSKVKNVNKKILHDLAHPCKQKFQEMSDAMFKSPCSKFRKYFDFAGCQKIRFKVLTF